MRNLRTSIVAALASIALATPALAGGQLVPPPSPFLTSNGSGFYFAVGTSAELASANVSGNVFALPGLTGGGLNAAGGTIDSGFGYIRGSCIFGVWCAVEVDAKYSNISGSNAVGSVSSRWMLTQEVDFGIDLLQTVLAYVPGFSNPFPSFNASGLLPANISSTVGPPQGFFGFKQAEMLISGNVGVAGGQTWDYAPGLTGGFLWRTLGTNGKPNGGALKVAADIYWMNKGASISNLFGVGGAPVITNANASMDTVYAFEIHYNFGL